MAVYCVRMSKFRKILIVVRFATPHPNAQLCYFPGMFNLPG